MTRAARPDGAAPVSDTLREHRAVWAAKPALRAVYEDAYRRIVAACRPGRTLEVGGGVGNLKAFLPDIVSVDIQPAPWLDAVADAHVLPFGHRCFANVVLFDVLHHLERPRRFLAEAARVLAPGGRLVLVEPAITPVSYFVFKLGHPEPVRLGEDPLAEGDPSPGRDPYRANQAIATRLLGRDRGRLAAAVPDLRLVERRRFGLFAYPLSGGFRRWSLLPARLVAPLVRLEERLVPWLGWLMAFRLFAVLERRS